MFQKLKNNYKNLKQSILSVNWNRNWEDEKIYLDQLVLERKGYSNSFIYDSLFQYKAQVYGVDRKKIIMLNIISLFGLIYLVSKFFFTKKIKTYSIYDVAYFYELNIFEEQKLKDKKLVFIRNSDGLLMIRDIVYLLKLMFLLRFNFILLSTIAFRLSQVVYARQNYKISEIWTNMEYSCASGALKVYCNEKGISFTNFMHGEKVLTLRDCFSSFDTFYVWDLGYMNLMKEMKTNSKIIISNPWNNEAIIRNDIEKKSVCYFLKGIETKVEINKLREVFLKLKKKGYKVYIKEHPRQYNNSSEFENVFVINRNADFLNLINKIELFMAQYSTILTQCEMLGINYVVDDISNEELSNKLRERGYLMSKNDNLLSKFIDEKAIL